MQTSTAFPPSAAAPDHAGVRPQRRVIDVPTRMFHWLFAMSFVGAYLTAEGERWRALHVTLGYALAGLLAFRVLYGLFGPRHASLGALMRKLASAPAWLRALRRGLAQDTASGFVQGVHNLPWRQGQNLAMALAVLAMLVLAVPLTLSGYASYQDWGGSFAGDALEELHEFFGNAFLAVVLVHIALIAGLSLLRHKNQALPMISGRVDGAGPDLIKHNHLWLAALLLLAVMAFIGWQWQQAPQGLWPVQGSAQTSPQRDGDEDD